MLIAGAGTICQYCVSVYRSAASPMKIIRSKEFTGSRAWEALEDAGRQFPLAFLWTGQPKRGEHGYWGIRVRVWPEDEELLLAHAGFHGQWLEWLGPGSE
jgi:hypothetical protein